MFQLASQLIAPVIAIALQHLQMAAKQFVLEQSSRRRVKLTRIQAVPAEIFGRLDQREPAFREIDAGKTLRRPDAHFPLGYGTGSAGRDIGYAAVGKVHTGVGDVLVVPEDRYT